MDAFGTCLSKDPKKLTKKLGSRGFQGFVRGWFFGYIFYTMHDGMGLTLQKKMPNLILRLKYLEQVTLAHG